MSQNLIQYATPTLEINNAKPNKNKNLHSRMNNMFTKGNQTKLQKTI